jgi:RNA polymerase sigma-70 factor (ECF subfamily)
MSSSAARYFPGALGKGITSTPAEIEASPSLSTEAARVEGSGQLSLPSDEALMASICDGDAEALALLFRRYARTVRGVVYRVLRDVSEADDLLQDVFLLIHRFCTNFDRSKGSARFWILQMAYRRAISRRRYLTCRHFYTRLDLDDTASELADPRTGVSQLEDSIGGRLGNGGLQQVFEALSENQRQTLRLFFIGGYTLDEIAGKLGQSRGNVKHHYFRGLDRLRRELFGGKLPGKRAV